MEAEKTGFQTQREPHPSELVGDNVSLPIHTDLIADNVLRFHGEMILIVCTTASWRGSQYSGTSKCNPGLLFPAIIVLVLFLPRSRLDILGNIARCII